MFFETCSYRVQFPIPWKFQKSLYGQNRAIYCQNMGSEFYGLTRKWFLQLDVELADLNGISHKINKKTDIQGKTG